jgi:hypothetical protein
VIENATREYSGDKYYNIIIYHRGLLAIVKEPFSFICSSRKERIFERRAQR